MEQPTETLSDVERESLVVALLCVNQFALEAGWQLRDALRLEGLTDPRSTAEMGIASVAAALERAGYKRGRVNEIVGPRIVALMKAINGGQLAGLSGAIHSRNDRAFSDLLQSVWGFGPTSIANAWLLLTPAKRSENSQQTS